MQGTQMHIMHEMRYHFVEIELVKYYAWSMNAYSAFTKGCGYEQIELKLEPLAS